jgi:hypothetical protein
MKHLIIVLALAAATGAALAGSTHAETASAPEGAMAAATQPGTPQRSKMKTCNADAKTRNLHGDERRLFMKQCLSGKAKPAAN